MDLVFVMDATGSMGATIQAGRDKIADLAFDLHIHNREADFQYGCVCYRDPVDCASDRHEVFNLNANAEEMSEFLEGVKATGGGDGPEDFVGALNCCFNQISWREGSKRAIIWIADAPAHGQRYCGKVNHQEEEPKLEPLVIRLAKDQYYFVALSLNGGADRSFHEMREIYTANGGKSFAMESFKPETGNEIDRIAATMAASTNKVVAEAMSLSDALT